MTSLKDKIAFAEKYIEAKEGHKFTIKGRDWVRDEFFKPADGFKLWKKAGVPPCESCLDLIGEIIEHPKDNPTTKEAHKKTGCPGLTAEPIIVTLINLQRQDGKTFSSMAYALSTLFKAKNKSFALLAASEQQAESLFAETYLEAINRNPVLRKRCYTTRRTLSMEKRGNRLEALSTSHKSVTGRSRTHILIDEARDIEARVAMALIPSIFAMHGVECPRGHVQISAEDMDKAPDECSACGARLTPWYGRIIITSSAGILSGDDKDWFNDTINELEANPHPNFHVFRSDRALNPRKSAKIINAMEEVFGRVDSTKSYIAAEVGNTWTRPGEDFLSKSIIKMCVDNRLKNEDGCTARCVGFLDTSRTIEKTSLVILADDLEKSDTPWEYTYITQLDVWDPAKQKGGVIDEEVIYQHLRALLPLFPGLITCPVDTRVNPWAIRLVKRLKQESGYGRAICGWNKRGAESQAGWTLLEERLMKKTIRMPNHEGMQDEFINLKRKYAANGQVHIVDRDRRKSHKDITESLAVCVYLAHMDSFKKRVSLSQLSRGTGRRILPRPMPRSFSTSIY